MKHPKRIAQVSAIRGYAFVTTNDGSLYVIRACHTKGIMPAPRRDIGVYRASRTGPAFVPLASVMPTCARQYCGLGPVLTSLPWLAQRQAE